MKGEEAREVELHPTEPRVPMALHFDGLPAAVTPGVPFAFSVMCEDESVEGMVSVSVSTAGVTLVGDSGAELGFGEALFLDLAVRLASPPGRPAPHHVTLEAAMEGHTKVMQTVGLQTAALVEEAQHPAIAALASLAHLPPQVDEDRLYAAVQSVRATMWTVDGYATALREEAVVPRLLSALGSDAIAREEVVCSIVVVLSGIGVNPGGAMAYGCAACRERLPPGARDVVCVRRPGDSELDGVTSYYHTGCLLCDACGSPVVGDAMDSGEEERMVLCQQTHKVYHRRCAAQRCSTTDFSVRRLAVLPPAGSQKQQEDMMVVFEQLAGLHDAVVAATSRHPAVAGLLDTLRQAAKRVAEEGGRAAAALAQPAAAAEAVQRISEMFLPSDPGGC